MRASPFDEEAMFRSIAQSGARALLIGRRALILTKRWSLRRKDVLDIDLLEKLQRGGGEAGET